MARAAKTSAPVDDAAYWPCLPVWDDDGRLTSIILTAFEVFMKKHPRVSSGYSVEALAKKLAPPALRKRFRHHPEAAMYAAYGDDPAALLAVAKLLRAATGMKPPKTSPAKTAMSEVAAAKLLADAFIATSDARAQATFVKKWPRPENRILERRLADLRAKSAKTRLESARFLMRQACRVVGRLDDAFCHPTTLDAFLAALAVETETKVYDELASLVAMWVHRGLPDLRAATLLASLVATGRKRVRHVAVLGLGSLSTIDWDVIAPVIASRDTELQLRVSLLRMVAEPPQLTPWILGGELVVTRARFPAKHRKLIAACARDKSVAVRTAAKAALAVI